jgi:hypothetical protein
MSEVESDYGFIFSVSGPLVVADGMSGSAMYELVRVGEFVCVGSSLSLSVIISVVDCYIFYCNIILLILLMMPSLSLFVF